MLEIKSTFIIASLSYNPQNGEFGTEYSGTQERGMRIRMRCSISAKLTP